ncbi:MAG: preprotein translocase subunit SecY [Clostridiaceae bacterium]|jgi:preprotein translocase subunit SecY|nr:preprotein translocase subunit SecY [Clostridiaceae bacterium]
MANNMVASLRNSWKIPDLRKKMLMTLLMLLIFRLGTHIPVPGLSAAALAELAHGGNSLFGYLNIISGGAFSNASIFAMSISPYITASIIIQLLTIAIPKLEQLSKEGEEGQKKIAQWTRYGAVILGFVQATAMYFSIRGAVINRGVLSYLTIVITFTAGTAFLMWLGEQITEYGIGNGISLIIFTGIVSRGPMTVNILIQYLRAGMLGEGIIGYIVLALIVLIMLAMIALVVYVQEAERRIPVQYAKRVVGRKMYGGQSTHIPIKVNSAGVMPIIFAMSIATFPPTIINMIWGGRETGKFLTYLKDMNEKPWFTIVYALLVMFFTFFYTMIAFNPVELANNIKKNGGFVPGIRPGKPTAEFITKVVNRVTWFGAFFLALVTVLPSLLQMFTKISNIWLGGTSLLIMVNVALETVKQIESQLTMRHYKGFLD